MKSVEDIFKFPIAEQEETVGVVIERCSEFELEAELIQKEVVSYA